jgi:hypothetical protein
MRGHFQRTDTHPARNRRFLKRQFLEFEQLNRLTLSARQALDGVSKDRRIAVAILSGVRLASLEGYLQIVDGGLVGCRSHLAARGVRDAVSDDRQEPWHERPGRIEGVSDGVHGKQDILDDVFDAFDAREYAVAAHDATNHRRNGLEELEVRLRISSLRGTHQLDQLTVVR